jgi:hypothetical protein
MGAVTKSIVSVFVLLVLTCLAIPLTAGEEEKPFAPQSQAALPPMLSIDWKKGPDLPQGFQDSAGGIVEGDRIHLLGGETGGCEIEGEKFGHHPDLYLVGKIREIKH